MKKGMATVALIVVLFMVLSGCVKINSTLTVNSDGSGDLSVIYGVNKQLAAMQPDITSSLQTAKKNSEKEGYTTSDYNDTQYMGIQLKKHINNLKDLKQFPNNNKVKFSVKEKKGFFKNTYDVNSSFDLTGLTDPNSNGLEESVAAAAVAQIDLKFTLNLPVAAGNNNASKVTNNNKTLEWTLVPNQMNNLNVQFSTVNMTNVVMLIGGIAIILILLGFFIFRKKKSHKNVVAA